MEKQIGIVGLGLLGSAIADRFLARTWKVEGFDLDPARRNEAERRGVRVALTAMDVFAGNRTVLLSLPSGRQVGQVLWDADNALHDGQLVLDTTTAQPAEMEGFAERVTSRGATYLEANVAGSSRQARECQALVLVGGSEQACQLALPVLRVFAGEVLHVGGSGDGSRFKLVHNLMLGLSRAALAESLALAAALGIDTAKVLDVLRASPAAYSRVVDTKGEKMVVRDFSTQATVRQHLKDVELMLAEAEAAHARLPLSEVHRNLLQQVVAAGHGNDDNSAVIRAYD